MCIAVYDARPRDGGDGDGEEVDDSFVARAERWRLPGLFLVRPSVAQVRAAAAAEAAASGTAQVQRTRRQTVDVAHMLVQLAPLAREQLVLLEDDWLLCEGGWAALQYFIDKATAYQRDWAALRFSYGLNGILLRAADVPPLAQFLLNPADADNPLPDAPVDHLVYRWLRGKYARSRAYFGARRIVAFRHALFWHIGGKSAVGNAANRHQPRCYTTNEEWLFEQERFHEDECPDDDVWPCHGRPDGNTTARAELRRLSANAVDGGAGGAARCGDWRVCWRRPGAAEGAVAGRCARRLLCEEGAAAPHAAARPCTAMGPRYRDDRPVN